MEKLSASLPKITFQHKRHLQLVNLAGDLAEQTREEAGALGIYVTAAYYGEPALSRPWERC